MNFSEEIINVLDYMCGKFGVAIDWTSGNVMPYLENLCEKFIKYEVYTSIAWIAIMISITAIIAIPLSISHKKANGVEWSEYEVSTVFAVIFWAVFAFFAIVSIFVIGTQVFDIIECCTIPEKTILEYLHGLMRTMSN